jgi:RimJ/RimL family protein N-acetyltransferase
MSFGWEGDLVRLAPLDLELHFENALRWMNDPDVTGTLLVGDRPITRDMEKGWFERQMAGPENEIAFAIETLDGQHIGFSGLHDIKRAHGTAICGSLIGDRPNRGKGYGTDAARVRSRYAFEELGLRILLSEHFEGNEASAAMLKKAGFVEWGTLPKGIWKRGRYVDEVKVCLTRERWLELKG